MYIGTERRFAGVALYPEMKRGLEPSSARRTGRGLTEVVNDAGSEQTESVKRCAASHVHRHLSQRVSAVEGEEGGEI